ncbi:MAG: hypothetical protein GEU92_19525 [Alphaproteobacteria bacterium]|nr:hypothetical protein [Alphaproteobacteria bacterium]
MLDDAEIDCIVAILIEMDSTESMLRVSELTRRVRLKLPYVEDEDIMWLLQRDRDWWNRRAEKRARLAVKKKSVTH